MNGSTTNRETTRSGEHKRGDERRRAIEGASQRAGCGEADGDGNKDRLAHEATARSLEAVRLPDVDAIGSRVEGTAWEPLTAPEMLTLALLALLVLVGIGSLMLAVAII